jgi:hypothetical protein
MSMLSSSCGGPWTRADKRARALKPAMPISIFSRTHSQPDTLADPDVPIVRGDAVDTRHHENTDHDADNRAEVVAGGTEELETIACVHFRDELFCKSSSTVICAGMLIAGDH